MAWIGPVLSILGTGYSLYQQNQDRQKAKHAEDENRRTAAWNALMTAAAGGTPQNTYQAGVIPSVNVGGAIANVGSAVSQYQAGQTEADRYKASQDQQAKLAKIAQDRQMTADSQATAAKLRDDERLGFDRQRLQMAKDEAWNNRMDKASDRTRQFELDSTKADHDRALLELRAKQIEARKTGGGGRVWVSAEEAGVDPYVKFDDGTIGEWDGYKQDYDRKIITRPAGYDVKGNYIGGGPITDDLPLKKRRPADGSNMTGRAWLGLE